MIDRYPKRIICLTEETTETLYLLNQQHRIVGVSGFTVRPPEARKEKPLVSAFTSAKYDKILELEPDLILGFSDIQSEIARDLVKLGKTVYVLNHRSVEEILDMIIQLGALTGSLKAAESLVNGYTQKIEQLKARNVGKNRPIIYFEEWDEPRISSIQWVAELIEIAGGQEAFPNRSNQSLAKDRIIADDTDIIQRQPDIIIGSWCGKKFRPEKVKARDGWDTIPAVQNNHIYEIKSPYILQPGPAALTDGLDQLVEIVDTWRAAQ